MVVNVWSFEEGRWPACHESRLGSDFECHEFAPAAAKQLAAVGIPNWLLSAIA
jgi:hypothetical protein